MELAEHAVEITINSIGSVGHRAHLGTLLWFYWKIGMAVTRFERRGKAVGERLGGGEYLTSLRVCPASETERTLTSWSMSWPYFGQVLIRGSC